MSSFTHFQTLLAGQKIHPALHFAETFATVGVLTSDNEVVIVSSDGHVLPASQFDSSWLLCPSVAYRGVATRWDASKRDAWVQGTPCPTLGQAVAWVRNVLLHYLELRRPEEASLVACWIVGTYFHRLFHAFPRLHFFGERGTGKSKLLQLAALLAFNGLFRISPTVAVLFRLIEPLRPTLCLDEVENLAGQNNKDLLAIINSGYKVGGVVDRVSAAEDRHIETFEVYSPLALAGISGLNQVTEDRCITLILDRGQDPDMLNREIDSEHPYFSDIRHTCYCRTLSEFQRVREAKDTLALPSWLVGRQRELYRPLLTLAALADSDGDWTIQKDVLLVAQSELSQRGGMALESECLLNTLHGLLGNQNAQAVRPMELVLHLEAALHRRLTPERIGRSLTRFGFEKKRDSAGTSYLITRLRLDVLMGTPSP